jgi:hypothetical protein
MLSLDISCLAGDHKDQRHMHQPIVTHRVCRTRSAIVVIVTVGRAALLERQKTKGEFRVYMSKGVRTVKGREKIYG